MFSTNRASSGRPEGLSQAVKCLYWMEDLYRRGDPAACLDAIKYTTCISALARSGQPDKAEDLLSKMCGDFAAGNDKAEPDCKIYEIVVSAWTGYPTAGKVDAGRADALLQHMWTLHNSGIYQDIRPSAKMYKRVVIAMKKAHRPKRAEELLFEMDSHAKKGSLKEGPGVEMYQTVINAWVDSKESDRKMRASDLQVKMLRRFHRSTTKSPRA